MRKVIQRTMITSTVNAFKLEVVDGQPKTEQLEPLTVTGKVTEKVALKLLKNKYGKATAITVSSIEEKEDVYEISVEDFMKYAHKVEPNTAETETETN